MIQIKSFTFNSFQENTYLLYDESGETLVIDPGCYEKDEKEELKEYIEKNGLKVTQLLNTHCHIDHVLGNKYIEDLYKVKLKIHKIEESILKAVKVYAPNYGFFLYQEAEIGGYLGEGDKVFFGNSFLNVLFVPGHAPGHIAFYNPEQKFCIAGDVLFRESIGRTDLPGGDYDTLINSIHTRLFTLENECEVYPGHGGKTTIGHEKKHNPFCAIT